MLFSCQPADNKLADADRTGHIFPKPDLEDLDKQVSHSQGREGECTAGSARRILGPAFRAGSLSEVPKKSEEVPKIQSLRRSGIIEEAHWRQWSKCQGHICGRVSGGRSVGGGGGLRAAVWRAQQGGELRSLLELQHQHSLAQFVVLPVMQEPREYGSWSHSARSCYESQPVHLHDDFNASHERDAVERWRPTHGHRPGQPTASGACWRCGGRCARLPKSAQRD